MISGRVEQTPETGAQQTSAAGPGQEPDLAIQTWFHPDTTGRAGDERAGAHPRLEQRWQLCPGLRGETGLKGGHIAHVAVPASGHVQVADSLSTRHKAENDTR